MDDDLKISDLPTVIPAANDFIEILDVSDVEMGASGSNRKALVSSLLTALGFLPGQVPYDRTYTHIQGSAASVWTITHNLGKSPSVDVVDSAGTKFIGDVNYIDLNTLTITFTAAFSGFAYCN